MAKIIFHTACKEVWPHNYLRVHSSFRLVPSPAPIFCSLQFAMTVMHGSGSVRKAYSPGNIHHGSTRGTQGGHWDGRCSLILRLHSTRSFILQDSLWQPCMGDSYLYFRFRVLNEVKVVESKLQECHIHLDRQKATQKEKGVMSGVMLILWNLYVTRVLLPSLDHSEFRYHKSRSERKFINKLLFPINHNCQSK